MPKPRRKPPTLSEKLASTLLMMVREDGNGGFVPVIAREEAKAMTTAQILGRFEFDHGIYATWGGSNHPANLTPRLKAAHREKTKRDVKNIAKVRRAERRKAGRKPKARMQYTAMKATHKRPFGVFKAVPR